MDEREQGTALFGKKPIRGREVKNVLKTYDRKKWI